MKRPWQIWIVFSVCLGVVVVAIGWLTAQAIALDDAEIASRRRAALEGKVRLALWRMDSVLAPLLAQQSAQQPFRPTGQKAGMAESTTASALLVQGQVPVLSYFRVSAAEISSGLLWAAERIENRLASGKAGHTNSRRAATLKRNLSFSTLRVQLPEPGSLPSQVVAMANTPERMGRGNSLPEFSRQQDVDLQHGIQMAAQQAVPMPGDQDFYTRSQIIAQNNLFGGREITSPREAKGGKAENRPLQTTIMTPLWVQGELLLARRVVVGGPEQIEVCWLDWPVIRAELIALIGDLLPQAELLPVSSPEQADQSRRLAALPVRIEPGALADFVEPEASSIRFSLFLAWGAFLLAVVAVGLLLAGVVSLSERRAAFVSAVTHELRTPLTTFRMYAEMLAEGMVRDEDSRRRYLHTLQSEADRLTHLVENVLAYARLERTQLRNRAEPIRVGDLVRQIQGRLTQRAEQVGMRLSIQMDSGLSAIFLRADVSAVEQILFNLVDNACKYAGTAQDRSLHWHVIRSDQRVIFRIQDNGPGITKDSRRELFRPFHKSAHAAAHSAPGVGLGLALSRRLARQIGGDLRLESDVPQGACFSLTLPIASGNM